MCLSFPVQTKIPEPWSLSAWTHFPKGYQKLSLSLIMSVAKLNTTFKDTCNFASLREWFKIL